MLIIFLNYKEKVLEEIQVTCLISNNVMYEDEKKTELGEEQRSLNCIPTSLVAPHHHTNKPYIPKR